jgi:four helix bundle protein
MSSAMKIYHLTKGFPPEERYSMVDQIRRSSRSVCANLAEAWRKRRYKAAFIAKLNDVESEACETQVWLDLAAECGFLDDSTRDDLHGDYEKIIKKIVKMIRDVDKWHLPVQI